MIARARLTPFALALCTPLTTAKGRLASRSGLLLMLEDSCGAVGFGEAMPLPAFGTETLEHCAKALERLANALVSIKAEDPATLAERIFGIAPDAPSARCAAEVALLDLASRRRGVRLCEFLYQTIDSAAQPREAIAVNALIAGKTPEAAASQARHACAAGFATLKLKIGAAKLEHDIERIAAVRDAVPAGTLLRLDANAAWTENEALRALARLAPHAIEFVEQPIAPHDIASLARVRAASPIPIAADEAVTGSAAALEIIRTRAADVLVLKPPTLGGLTATLDIAGRAADAGLEVVVTSFLDSSIGIAAALHCASVLARPLACGLATAGLLEKDLATNLAVKDGKLTLPERPGLGIVPRDADLTACATHASLEIAR